MINISKKIIQTVIIGLLICYFNTHAHANDLQNPTSKTDLHDLSFVGGYVRDHPTTHHVLLPFLKQIALDLDNAITFKYYATNELYNERDTYAVFEDGRVDFGVLRPGLFHDKMPLNSVLVLPNIAPNAIVGSLLAQDIAKKFPALQAEFPEKSELFALWTSAAYQLHSKIPIKNLTDIKGKTIIAWEPSFMHIIEKLGGIPIRIPTTESYEALRTGKADAILAPIAPIRSFKISDVAPYHLILNLGVSTFSLSCYKPLWNTFSPDVQRYFKSQGGALFSFDIAESIEAGAMRDKKYMESLGHEFYKLSDSDKEDLKALFADSHVDWVNSMPEEKKAIAKKILDYTLERSDFYKKVYETGIYGEWGEIYL